MKILCLALLIALMSFWNVYATTFQSMSLSQLVTESNAAAEVELKEKQSYMTSGGTIQTTYKFKIHESYNLSGSDLDDNFLSITTAGGTVGGITSYIENAPSFLIGEKNFLLLKKQDNKIYLSNFTMGKYKILNEENQIYYESTVFPLDRDIGRIKKEKMISTLKEKFKVSSYDKIKSNTFSSRDMFKKNVKMEYDKKINRKIAQIENAEPASLKGFWALIIYSVIFAVSSVLLWWKLGKGANE